jgi:hypothetical protein
MKIRIEVTKGQHAVLEPKGFVGAVTGQGQALFGDSATIEFKDDGEMWPSSSIASVISTMGETASDALVAIADKPEAVG